MARNDPFIDGNKSVAFQAMYVFLGLNGFRIESREEEVVSLMLSVASGDTDELQLASWLRENTDHRERLPLRLGHRYPGTSSSMNMPTSA